MEDTTYTQPELPFPANTEARQFRPYITIDGDPTMHTDVYDTEDAAADALFSNLGMLQVLLDQGESRFTLTRRDAVSFTAYLYDPIRGARVVRGGVEWLAPA
jgi:hypothetical protein